MDVWYNTRERRCNYKNKQVILVITTLRLLSLLLDSPFITFGVCFRLG